MKISLNIFTNCTSYAPGTNIIENTYSSFVDVFGGNYETTIFIDSHPNMNAYEKYKNNIINKFTKAKVVRTNSLSDGYVKSIKQSDSDYMFMLEHDWIFIKENIKYSLEDICQLMLENKLYHFRFNKRKNQIAGWDRTLKEVKTNDIHYCMTHNMSNNPHIIERKKYNDIILQYIRIRPSSKGIEEELNAQNKFFSCIYGGLNYPATINHVDGRKLDKLKFKKGRYR